MPVLTSSTSSPSRRLGTSYTSSYSSSYGSSYTRTSYGLGSSSRTSSLDRSPYTSSYVTSSSSYKYTSPSLAVGSSSRDYTTSSRPPISTRTTSSSLYRCVAYYANEERWSECGGKMRHKMTPISHRALPLLRIRLVVVWYLLFIA